MGDETIVGGYVLGEALDLGTLSADEVAQVDTAINPDDNLYTVRFYGRDGELIEERQLPVEWDETGFTTVHDEDVPERDIRLSADEPWRAEFTGFDNIRIPYMTYDGNSLSFYGNDGELAWRADGVGVTMQGTSSVEYHTALNMRDLWQMPVYDEDTAITDDYERYSNPYIRRYNEGELRDRAEEYLRTTYGTRTEMREDFIRARSRYLDEIFLKGEWKIPEEEEQPDIQEERGGALDEFLEKFTPQKTTPERSDEQE